MIVQNIRGVKQYCLFDKVKYTDLVVTIYFYNLHAKSIVVCYKCNMLNPVMLHNSIKIEIKIMSDLN
jgi:hypothetical protein